MSKNNHHDLHLQEVTIAALFHDIGKFKQHGEIKPQNTHQHYSGELIRHIPLPKDVNRENIAKLIELHHSKGESVEGQIELKSADWTSAGMDREKSEDEDPNREIISIFSEIPITSDFSININTEPVTSYYRPNKISIVNKETIFPQPKKLSKDEIVSNSRQLWDEFVEVLKTIPQNLTFYPWIIQVEAIFRKYLFNILSAGYKTKPTISLYHHLTSTAAIATSTIRYRDVTHPSEEDIDATKEDRHLIIAGDMNKIQSFIFSVSSPAEAQKGMSKRLRGRSFSIQIITDAIINKILFDLQLPVTSILTQAAGNFRIIAANTGDTIEKLEKTKKEITQELYNRYGDDLRVTLVWQAFSNSDLKDFSSVEQRLGIRTIQQKYHPYDDLTTNQSYGKSFFEAIDTSSIPLKCRVCDLPTQNELICDECLLHEEIGGKLPRASYLVISRETDISDSDFSIFGITYRLVDSEEELNKFDPEKSTVIALDDNNFPNPRLSKMGLAQSYQYFGLSLPVSKENIPLSFHEISKAAIGIERFGILKADVDNLGNVFSYGLKKEQGKSLAKIKDLSTRIEIFFSGYTQELANKSPYLLYHQPCENHTSDFMEIRDEDDRYSVYRYLEVNNKLSCDECTDGGVTTAIYSVFAGGDDVAFVGPWDLLVRFAQDLQQSFQEYTSHNPWLTLSAAIDLFREKEPIGMSLRTTEDHLEQSKALYKNSDQRAVKNSMSLFGELVLWNNNKEIYPDHEKYMGDFSKLLELGIWLEKQVINKELSRSFLYYLYQLWETTFTTKDLSELVDQRLIQIDYFPRLAYKLSRERDDKKTREEYFNKIKQQLPWIRLPVSWSLYRTRG